ncbi:MAG: class II fructose-bisphosphate aldolase [Anaerolineae bacterium]|jgi:fructose-bisphosphate aldolase class II
MPLISANEILNDARAKSYGVLSLLGGDLAMVVGLVQAAEEKRAPLILVYNEDVTPQVPMEIAIPCLVTCAQNASVPIVVILDHGRDLEQIARAIRLGCPSVMYDGSALPYEENVSRTAEVVRVAHAAGVDVEAELGSISGSAVDLSSAGPEATFTDPELAAEFVDRTGADVLAVSFGNVHGVYRGEPHLELDRVRAIRDYVSVPLSMHGASGLSYDDYPAIVESGISKVCYYTAMGIGASDAIRDFLVEAGNGNTVYHQVLGCAVDYFRAETARLIDLVGCANTAA